MQIIRQARELSAGARNVCVAIGMFDGVHLGHQQVIRQTIADARQLGALSLAVTFDKHPGSVVNPARAPQLLYSLSQKIREIQSLGVDALLLLEFNRDLSEIPGERFIRELARDLRGIRSVSVGSNFTFGHKRGGNVELLRRIGEELNFQVHGLAAVSLGGKVVSSTRIRERVAAGDLDAASQMLGRPYAIRGEVMHGDQIGRKLGVPTANICIAGLITPPPGVYAVLARTESATFRGVANLGARPTVSGGNPELRLEVHLFDFTGDLYGVELEVCFAGFIRQEKRFSGLDELRAQIHQDIQTARGSFR